MNFKVEISRKIVHLSSSIIAFSVLVLDKNVYLPILFTLTILFLAFDYLRIKSDFVSKYYYRFFGVFTRVSEKKQLTGASFVFIGSLVTAFLFDNETAFIGLLTMSLSDSFAAVIGISFGKTKLFNKSLEGSLAFFLVTFTVLFFFDFTLLEIFIISFIATCTELFSTYKYNDNVLIPLVTSTAVYIAKIF
tara:strand:- start:139 stop:711 length:573 start_codon:yes stop_codon:yes gene_type:complete